jgi:hypothetical protein
MVVKRNLRKNNKSYRISKKNKKRKNSKKRVNKRGVKKQQKFIGGGLDEKLMRATDSLMDFYRFIVLDSSKLDKIIRLTVLFKRKIESDPKLKMEYTKRLEMMSVEDVISGCDKIKQFCQKFCQSEKIGELIGSLSDVYVSEVVEEMKTEIQKIQRSEESSTSKTVVPNTRNIESLQMPSSGQSGGSDIGRLQFFGGGVIMFLSSVLAGRMTGNDVLLGWAMIGLIFSVLFFWTELLNGVIAQDEADEAVAAAEAGEFSRSDINDGDIIRFLQGRGRGGQ